MKPWEESDRYNYPLTGSSFVMDVGGFGGNFSAIIRDKYGCRVKCYEPAKGFYEAIAARFLDDSLVEVVNYGLGDKTELRTFRIKGDMTGAWADYGPTEVVQLVGIGDEMRNLGNPTVDLLKINTEGGEYPLMESILDQGLVGRFRNIQIQFHAIPDLNPIARWEKIRNRLTETHRLEYADPSMEFTSNSWEGWSIR
jgi:FkbM family methyltransferase